MLEREYQEYKEWAEDDTLAHPFKEMLTSGKIWTDVYFPDDLIEFLQYEAMVNNEENVRHYVSEQLLKLIHLSLVFADERGIDLNELRNFDLAQMEDERI
jgi:hypothetical protein